MSDFRVFLEKLSQFGLEFFRVYPGVYRAQVSRVDDPDQRGRIQIMCPSVGHSVSQGPDVWVDPVMSNAGTGHGMFWPPVVGDSVWISFRNGNASRPECYWGGWYGQGEVPSELGARAQNLPTVRGFKTPGGHVLAFSDEPGDEHIHIVWKDGSTSIKIEKDKGIHITNGTASIDMNADGSSVLKDPAGAKLTLDGKGSVLVEGIQILLGGLGSVDPVMKFTEFFAWAAAHTHVGGTGPTSPPVPPPPPSIASTNVFVKS